MITIKNRSAIEKMQVAGQRLAAIFAELPAQIKSGVSTLELDEFVAQRLQKNSLVSKAKGYNGYKHVSCISVNDEVVHGVPHSHKVLKDGDMVKVDVCASWKGYCADMARVFFVGTPARETQLLAQVAQSALDKGIAKVQVGNRVSDISFAIQQEIELHGFGIVRDFAGHGIGKRMHEDPEILNYGRPGKGPVLKPGMAFAIEPMITQGKHDVFIEDDGWTVKTVDQSMAAHVEDTVVVTDHGPKILTRMQK